MRQRAVVASGERSVAVGRDLVGSLVITGDENTVNLLLGEEHGDLLELLRRRDAPDRSPLPRPVDTRQEPFANHLDRDEEVDAVFGSGPQRAVNLYGEAGIGKTYALYHVAKQAPAEGFADGFAHLFAEERRLDDLLQDLYEQFYECRTDPPFKPSRSQILRELGDTQALLAVDAVALTRDQIQVLVGAAPRSTFVLASDERVLWDGPAVELPGLELEYALRVVEQELGRPLADDERRAAERVCRAVGGHPWKLRAAVASANDRGDRLEDVAAALERSAGVDRLVASLSADELRVLEALAPFGDASLGRDRIAELVDVPDLDAVLDRLERLQLLRSHSPRYSLSSAVVPVIPVTPAAEERALAVLSRWVENNRTSFPELLVEANALLRLLRRAAKERPAEAVRLGRALGTALTWGRRWDAWGELLRHVREAAGRGEDPAGEAWALHQLGTREFCLDQPEQARAALEEALEIRERIRDEPGAAATRHNLGVIAAAPPPDSWLDRLGVRFPFTFLVAAIATLVAASGVTAAWLTFRDDKPPAPPDLTARITAAPPDRSETATARFAFAAGGDADRFSCSLDGDDFAPCASPKSYVGLTEGAHRFAVRAGDAEGHFGTPARDQWTIALGGPADDQAPETTINVKPPNPSETADARFEFEATEADVRFHCRLDDGDVEECSSPKLYASLEDGRHTFGVHAVDRAGNVGEAAVYDWVVKKAGGDDETEPTTTITQAPPETTNSTDARFEFAADEDDVEFGCSLDGAESTPCESGQTYEGLAPGPHSFAVRGVDAAENVGEAARHEWTIESGDVDTEGPATRILRAPERRTTRTTAAFAFASEEGATFACTLDKRDPEECNGGTVRYDELAVGAHSFVVRARDANGNPGPPSTWSWMIFVRTVDRTKPVTTITARPEKVTLQRTAVFAFEANEPNVEFWCSLDGGGAERCTSAWTIRDLTTGTHTFRVYAKDAAGNQGEPATYEWAVDQLT